MTEIDMESDFDELVEEEFLNTQSVKDPNIPAPTPAQSTTSSSEKKQRKTKAQKKQEKSEVTKKQEDAKRKEWEEEQRKELEDLKSKRGKFVQVDEIKYPSSLNSYERMTVHAIADTLGLEHASTGEGKDRTLIVCRPRKSTEKEQKENEGKGDEEKGIEVVDGKDSKKGKKQKKPKAPADPYADEVDVDLSKKKNKPMQEEEEQIEEETANGEGEEGGEGVLDEGEEEQEADTTKKPKKKKNKKKKSENPNNTNKGKEKEEEDIDKIIDELHMNNTRCRIDDCKNNILISRFCEFCKYRFCMYHGLAEVHGCGDEAKKKARAEWLKHGTAKVTGQPLPKPLKDWEKNYVHNKLQKKLDEAAKSRGAKQAEKKKK